MSYPTPTDIAQATANLIAETPLSALNQSHWFIYGGFMRDLVLFIFEYGRPPTWPEMLTIVKDIDISMPESLDRAVIERLMGPDSLQSKTVTLSFGTIVTHVGTIAVGDPAVPLRLELHTMHRFNNTDMVANTLTWSPVFGLGTTLRQFASPPLAVEHIIETICLRTIIALRGCEGAVKQRLPHMVKKGFRLTPQGVWRDDYKKVSEESLPWDYMSATMLLALDAIKMGSPRS